MNARESSYNNLNNEGGEGYIPEYLQRPAQIAIDLNDWTLPATTSRRGKWNAEMMSAKAEGREINLRETEKKMGFDFNSLKIAVRHYSL